jgi:hypothetical protein
MPWFVVLVVVVVLVTGWLGCIAFDLRATKRERDEMRKSARRGE